MLLRERLFASFASAAVMMGGLGGCHSGTTKWNYLPSDALRAKPLLADNNHYAIMVGSIGLVDVPLLEHADPVHHFIRIFDCVDGEYKGFLCLDGVSITRRTGEIEFNADALCVRFWAEDMMTRQVGIPRAPLPSKKIVNSTAPTGETSQEKTETENPVTKPAEEEVSESDGSAVREMTEIYAGSGEDVLRKIIIMVDAANFINDQNLVYQLLDIFQQGQNSNSVAYSLLHAAGLDIPPQNRAYFDPGSKRLLLPQDWRSYYQDWQPPVEGELFLTWYLKEMLAQLDRNRGYNQNLYNPDFSAADYKAPPSNRPLFFDPQKPFVPYRALIIENAAGKFAEFQQKSKPEAPSAQTSFHHEPLL